MLRYNLLDLSDTHSIFDLPLQKKECIYLSNLERKD